MGSSSKERNREELVDLVSTEGITADIGGTSLVWRGRMLDRKDARRNEKLIEPLVAPGVAEITATLYEEDIGLKLLATRGSSLSDDEACAFRDKAYETFAADSDARLELYGFPSCTPRNLSGKRAARRQGDPVRNSRQGHHSNRHPWPRGGPRWCLHGEASVGVSGEL